MIKRTTAAPLRPRKVSKSRAHRSSRYAPTTVTDGSYAEPSRTNTSLFQSQGGGADAMQERVSSWGLSCARLGFFSCGGHYRLAGGRFKDALAAPPRGRAAPGP